MSQKHSQEPEIGPWIYPDRFLERAAIAEGQDANEEQKFVAKPTRLNMNLFSVNSMTSWGASLVESALAFCYPANCLHCSTPLDPFSREQLCHACSSQLVPIDPQWRCRRCFSEVEGGNRLCTSCQVCRGTPLEAMGAVFDYRGVAATLVRSLKYGQLRWLSEAMAGYMAYQLLALKEWPWPDLLVPVPMVTSHWFSRGFNQSQLLAEELSHLINRPCRSLLGRRMGDYSQAGLSLAQRKELSSSHFFLLERDFEGKRLLVIDDVATTGTTLQRCTELLATGYPAAIYAMTFCRA